MKGALTLMSPLFNLLQLSAKSVEKKERGLTGSALPVLFMFCLNLFRISKKTSHSGVSKSLIVNIRGNICILHLCEIKCLKHFFFCDHNYCMFDILKRCVVIVYRTEMSMVWGVCVLIK